MSIKDLFIIIIKLLGLYFLITNLFSDLAISVGYFLLEGDLGLFLGSLPRVIVTAGLWAGLILYANRLVEILKPHEGFEKDTVDFNGHGSEFVVKVGCFVIGGLLLINNLPLFIQEVSIAFQSESSESNGNMNWVGSAINLVIGVLLIRNHNQISKLLVNSQ